MKIKHKLLSDYQYVSDDKKIFLIKTGSILQDYVWTLKGESIKIDKELVENNPDLFQLIDWKAELLTYMRSEKMPQPAQLGKKLIPFLEELVFSSINQNPETQVQQVDTRALESREWELDSRERKIKDSEYEIEIRNKRLDKRESEYKQDMTKLIEKEDDLRNLSRNLTEKEGTLNTLEKKLNERERNIESELIKNSEEFDSKFKELREKIDEDYKNIELKEKDLENKENDLRIKESEIQNIIESNSYNDKQNKALIDEILSLESNIREIHQVAQSLVNFGHPLIENIAKQLVEMISSLKHRVDTNFVK